MLPSVCMDVQILICPRHAQHYTHTSLVLDGTGGLSNFFVDGEDGKPWSNTGKGAPYLFAKAKDEWYPTWAGRDSALQVCMLIFQRCEEGRCSSRPTYISTHTHTHVSPYIIIPIHQTGQVRPCLAEGRVLDCHIVREEEYDGRWVPGLERR